MDTDNSTTPGDELQQNSQQISGQSGSTLLPPEEEKAETDFPTNDEEFQKHLRAKVLPQLLRFFHPELLNRFDEIIFFHPLRRQELQPIVELMLKEPREMLKEKNMLIRISDSAKMFIAERGYDPAFGARPLRRAVQQYVEDPLSDALIRGDFEGGDTIYIELAKDGTKLTFRKDVADAQEKILDPFAVLEQEETVEPVNENQKPSNIPEEGISSEEKGKRSDSLEQTPEKIPEQKENFFGKMFKGNPKPQEIGENTPSPQSGEKHIRFVDGRIVEE